MASSSCRLDVTLVYRRMHLSIFYGANPPWERLARSSRDLLYLAHPKPAKGLFELHETLFDHQALVSGRVPGPKGVWSLFIQNLDSQGVKVTMP